MPFQCSQSAMSHFLLFAGKNLAINVEHNHRHTNEPMFANLGAGSLKKCRRNQSAIRPLVQLTAATPTTAPSKKIGEKSAKTVTCANSKDAVDAYPYPQPLSHFHSQNRIQGIHSQEPAAGHAICQPAFEKRAEQKQSQRIESATENMVEARIECGMFEGRGGNASKPHSRYNCIFEIQTDLYALALGSSLQFGMFSV